MTQREIRKKFDEIVAFAEVERFLDTPVKRYSSGMYVRLAFAVAAHLEPEILVVDEVLAVGDAEFQKKCLGKMSEVAAGGRTVLFVSHNMNTVGRLCDAVVLLEGGRTQGASGEVQETIRKYLNPDIGDAMRSRWERPPNFPKNEFVLPIMMSARQGRHASERLPFRNDEGITVRIDGTIHQSHPALTMGIALFANDGTLLFWSYTTDTKQSMWPVLAPGAFTLQCEIPPHLLNEGDYRVEFIAGLHYIKWLLGPGEGPWCNILIRDGLSDSPIWRERRPGLLAPVLKWSIAPQFTSSENEWVIQCHD
jgi:lipopolysaccharide transport system ATP-binding protein